MRLTFWYDPYMNKGTDIMTYQNAIAILIEDLSSGEQKLHMVGEFVNHAAAVTYCERLNDYYCDNCIPKIAGVTYRGVPRASIGKWAQWAA
jgi:hypothetical protein